MDPRIARRRVEVRRQEGRRRLRLLIACAGAAAAVSLLIGSLWTPLFKVRHVRVNIEGVGVRTPAAPVTSLSASQVVIDAGLAKRRLMIDVDGAATARRLDAVPVLAGARVSVDWPGTVKITVVERRPVAEISAGGSHGVAPHWAVVDPTGRVLFVTASVVPGLPVIYGAGSVPGAGGWVPGSAGPATPVPPSGGGSGAGLVNMNAQSDGTDIPRGVAAALAIATSMPSDILGDVQSITIPSVTGTVGTGQPAMGQAGGGPAPGLSLWVLPPKVASGSIKVVFGDGSQLRAKLNALETLLTKADLTGVAEIDLTVPDRPAALTAR